MYKTVLAETVEQMLRPGAALPSNPLGDCYASAAKTRVNLENKS